MTNPPTTAADALVADARRAVHESLVFLAAPEADRVRALIADLETAVEGRTAILMGAAVSVGQPARTEDPTVLRERIADVLADADGCRWVPDFDRHRSPAYQALLARADKVLAALAGTTAPTGDSDVRSDVLRALDFPLCQTLGYTTPEGLLAAYDTTMRAASVPLTASERGFLGYALMLAADQMANRSDEFGPDDEAALAALRRLAAGAQQPTRCTCTHTRSMHTGRNLFCAVPACQCAQYAGAQQQPTTETQPPRYRWRVETRDGVADEWAPGSAYLNRHHAVERYEALTEHHPKWKDGTSVERRIVRETTTYTVEQPTTETPALATQAGRDQATIARVRAVADRLADGTEAGFRAALAVRDALDGTEQATTCTATIGNEDNPEHPIRCIAPAGHYDEQQPALPDRNPGGWHTNGQGHMWCDRAATATPHCEQPTTETPTTWTPGPVAVAQAGDWLRSHAANCIDRQDRGEQRRD